MDFVYPLPIVDSTPHDAKIDRHDAKMESDDLDPAIDAADMVAKTSQQDIKTAEQLQQALIEKTKEALGDFANQIEIVVLDLSLN